MKAFQGQATRSAKLKRSRSFVWRSAGPTGRLSCARSSSYVSGPIARTNAHNGNHNYNADSLAMRAQDAFKQLAPFAPRDTNEAVAEIDILGIGQAAVDFAASVEDQVLAALDVSKGGRRVITADERAQVMELLDGYDSQVSAGGSLANILVGLGQLAAARQRIASLHCSNNHAAATSSTPISAATSSSNPMTIKVAMTGCVVGSDALGEFAAAQLEAAAVEVVPTQPPSSSATGVVMVLTTPDAQRSFLSSFSSKDRIVLTYELKATVARSRLVVIEGYMWEVQGAAEVIPEIIRHARSCGTLVALTAGDASVVQRHASKVLAAIDAGIDIWFGNEVEAAALVCSIKHQQAQQGPQQQVQHSITANTSSAWQQTAQMQLERADSTDSSSSNVLNNQVHGRPVSHGQECALELASICPMIVVTDGSRGSYITALGQLIVVPPYWNANSPVDTCGAGDAYAAGLLYSFLTGLDLHSMGQVAAKTASAVISKHGPQLLPEDADWVAAGMLQQQGGLSTALAGAGAITQAVRPVVKVHWSPVKDAAVGGAAAGSGMNNNINGPQQ